MGRSKFALPIDCDHSQRTLIASAEDVASEIELRREFFLDRIEGPVEACDLRDLTEMTTNEPAAIHACRCGVLVREDPVRTPVRFARDRYDERTLRGLHALHTGVFSARTAIRDLLPRGSRVLEIGSYAGGFLEAARGWGWNATGVDIGRDTAAFLDERGYDVRSERFERCDLPPQSFDGIFIWNCFEQLTNPSEVLLRAFEIARPGAPLAIEVPDGAFYRQAEHALATGEPRIADSPVVQQLAYNNLLGFPHHFGYSAESLTRLVTAHGFDPWTIRQVPAIRPLRDRLTAAARAEEMRVSPGWIEAVFARQSVA